MQPKQAHKYIRSNTQDQKPENRCYQLTLSFMIYLYSLGVIFIYGAHKPNHISQKVYFCLSSLNYIN